MATTPAPAAILEPAEEVNLEVNQIVPSISSEMGAALLEQPDTVGVYSGVSLGQPSAGSTSTSVPAPREPGALAQSEEISDAPAQGPGPDGAALLEAPSSCGCGCGAPAPVAKKTDRRSGASMLLRWGLEPVILDQLPSEGATLIEKLERYLVEDGQVRYAVVLATPDDEGHPRAKPDEKRFRARQNVVLELGVLLSRLGRRRVAILLKDQANMERPSDIQGLVYIPFTEQVEDAKVTLAKEMKAQGIDIDVAKL